MNDVRGNRRFGWNSWHRLDCFKQLVALAAFFGAGGACAAYANLSLPGEIGAGNASAGGGLTYKASAMPYDPGYIAERQGLWDSNGRLNTSGSLNTGGQATKVPVRMRLSANSGRYFLRGLSGGWLGIGIMSAMAIPEVISWLNDSGVKYDDGVGQWQKFVPGDGEGSEYPTGDGIFYRPSGSSSYFGSVEQAVFESAYSYGGLSLCAIGSRVSNALSYPIYYYFFSSVRSDGSCGGANVYTAVVYGSSSVPAGSPYTPYVPPSGNAWVPADLEADVIPLIGDLPGSVVEALPENVPLPVEIPVINPDENGNPQPLVVPTGSPVAVPGTSPQSYSQPVSNIAPANDAANPLRVDVQPQTIVTTDSVGLTEPVSQVEPNPDALPNESPGLCDMFPSIVACATLDVPDDVDLPVDERVVSVVADSGWGASDATCPAPRVITPAGQRIEIPFDLFCTFMSGIRPVVIAMAWLSAAFIVLGFKQEG